MNYYIVYDGRAEFDVEKASILDCIGNKSKRSAIKEFKDAWLGHDAVLFEYDVKGGDLDNGRMVYP